VKTLEQELKKESVSPLVQAENVKQVRSPLEQSLSYKDEELKKDFIELGAQFEDLKEKKESFI